MARKGISEETIIDEAMQLIREDGADGLSMRKLAARLHIQAPSLYNHYQGVSDILQAAAARTEQMLSREIAAAADGKTRGDAFRAFASAQLSFSLREPNLYEVLLRLPSLHSEEADRIAERTVRPILNILSQYDLTRAEKIHLHRMIRSFLHGFFALSRAGFLSHREYSTTESFDASVDYFLTLIEQLETKRQGSAPSDAKPAVTEQTERSGSDQSKSKRTYS